jgi:hypothetical protein
MTSGIKPAIKTLEAMPHLLVAILGEPGWHKTKFGLVAKTGRR